MSVETQALTAVHCADTSTGAFFALFLEITPTTFYPRRPDRSAKWRNAQAAATELVDISEGSSIFFVLNPPLAAES